MVRRIRNLCVLLCVVHYAASTIGQQDSMVVQDFETWSSFALRTELLDDKLEFKVSQNLRFNENSSALGILFTQFGGSYEIIDGLKLGAAYRYINETDENTGNRQWRAQADLGYGHKLNRFKLSCRLRYQLRDYFQQSKGNGDYPTSKLRLALKLDYNVKNWKLDPYLKAELFHAKTTEDAVEYIPEVETGSMELSGFEKVRFTLGTNLKPFKRARLGLYYRIEKGFNTFPTYLGTTTFNPETIYILGFNFSYKLNLKKNE